MLSNPFSMIPITFKLILMFVSDFENSVMPKSFQVVNMLSFFRCEEILNVKFRDFFINTFDFLKLLCFGLNQVSHIRRFFHGIDKSCLRIGLWIIFRGT